jgi:hypothetical protein
MSKHEDEEKGLKRIDGPEDPAPLPVEIIEALDAANTSVNVNLLLIELIQKSQASEFLERTDKLIEIVQKFELSRVENFRARADAIIDAKTRDPDEQDKRANNRTRRYLKYMIGALAPAGLVAATLGMWQGAPALVVTTLLTIVAVSLALAGRLAAGESVTTTDIVRIVREIGGFRTRNSEEPTVEQKKSGRGKR